jgi:phage gp45-like
MHRQTPLTAGYTGYTSGGARALIDTIDDSTGMQQMKGSMMGESREAVESPQNYGFSSVVRAATKDKDGNVQDCAEGFMSYFGGSRTSNFCAVMDDRRYRPMGLKQGENAQYDDLGQMTLLRRAGLFLLTLDSPDDSQKQSSGASPGQHDGSSGGSSQKNVERYVSIRHVEKQKQTRPQRGGGQGQNGGASGGGASAGTLDASGGGQSQQDFKHEGESVNHEIRVSKGRIEFRSGDAVVGYYDGQSKKWSFTGEMHLGADSASHPAYGVSGGVGMTTVTSGSGAVLVNATKPGPPTSMDGEPFEARDAKIAQLEARIAALEARLA